MLCIFTKGADRASGTLETVAQLILFLGSHLFWLSWQAGVVGFIKQRSGQAEFIKPFSERFEFDKVLAHFRGGQSHQ
jgi:hypothetical protein